MRRARLNAATDNGYLSQNRGHKYEIRTHNGSCYYADEFDFDELGNLEWYFRDAKGSVYFRQLDSTVIKDFNPAMSLEDFIKRKIARENLRKNQPH